MDEANKDQPSQAGKLAFLGGTAAVAAAILMDGTALPTERQMEKWVERIDKKKAQKAVTKLR